LLFSAFRNTPKCLQILAQPAEMSKLLDAMIGIQTRVPLCIKKDSPKLKLTASSQDMILQTA
jgi:hypothetical protein